MQDSSLILEGSWIAASASAADLVGWEPADDPTAEHRSHLKMIPNVQGVPVLLLAC